MNQPMSSCKLWYAGPKLRFNRGYPDTAVSLGPSDGFMKFGEWITLSYAATSSEVHPNIVDDLEEQL